MTSRCTGVSPAIINHYFGGKHGLHEATMRHVLRQLGDGIRRRLDECDPDDALARIEAIVAGNLDPRQLESRVVKTWLAFWPLSMHDPVLCRLQRVNERSLRSHLCLELQRLLPRERAQFVAQSVAALIDGIWPRGALTADRARLSGPRPAATRWCSSRRRRPRWAYSSSPGSTPRARSAPMAPASTCRARFLGDHGAGFPLDSKRPD